MSLTLELPGDEPDPFAGTANWTPEAKRRAFEELQAAAKVRRQVFYCTDEHGRPNRPKWRLVTVETKEGSRKQWERVEGTGCDGAPHGQYNYRHARSDQWPPPGADWFLWFLMGGRGSGKTRTGAEYVRQLSKSVGRIALIGATNQAVRDTMVEGVSGLAAVFASYGEKIDYKPALKRITFPSGAVAGLFTGEEPDRLRGPQHGAFWIDEPSHFPLIDEVWDQLMFGLRLGTRPHGVCTSTPLPNKWTKARIAEANTRLSRVSTYANMANLAPQFRETVLARYEGTRLGRQELEGEILEDVEGALWKASLIVASSADLSEMDRIIVSIDPAGTANRRSDETGIVIVGKRGRLGYVLADYSDKYSPQGWAEKAIWATRAFKADAIIAEKNFGGDMVKSTIESAAKELGQTVRVIVTTASRSKALRAEPIVALYEQSRIFHNGLLASLEEEMLTWVPGKSASPNRIDAMVHGFTELFGTDTSTSIANPSAGARLPKRPRSFETSIKRGTIRRKLT